MRIFKIRQNTLLFHLLTFNADPFLTCSPSLLCWATWNQNAFQLHQSRNALCPYIAKQGQGMQVTAEDPPQCLCSACDSSSPFLWGPQHCKLLWEETFTKLSATLFASPCTVQKILQQKLWGKKDKLNLPLTVKLTTAGFFSLAHLKKYVFKSFDPFSQNKQQLGNTYLCHTTAFQVTGQNKGYLDELIIFHIVQSVWSVATSNNRRVCQDVSTTSPALEFKLERRGNH